MSKKLLAFLVTVFALAMPATAAPIVTIVTIGQNNQIGSFQNVLFSVTSAGTFTISAEGAETLGAGFNSDPQIFLFNNDGSLDASDFIAENDDSGGSLNSLLSQPLALGNYLLAVTEFDSTVAQAVLGIEDSISQPGTFIQVTIDSLDGAASSNAVPEPTSLALVALALAGLGFARRRRSL